MSKEMGIIVLGVFVVIQPFLGVPDSWHTFLSLAAGLAILVLGFLLRGEALSSDRKGSSKHSFVENNTATIVQDYSSQEHTHEHKSVGSLN